MTSDFREEITIAKKNFFLILRRITYTSASKVKLDSIFAGPLPSINERYNLDNA